MIKFGTGGWRAIIGEEFIKSNILLVAQAIGALMKEENCTSQGMVLGFDRRFLSNRAARWIAEVLAGNEIKVYFIHQIAPTPLIMYTVKELGCHYGLAITASHNPAEYNGIKVFTYGGRDATEEVTRKIEKKIGKLEKGTISPIQYSTGEKEGLIVPIDPFNQYIDTIMGMIDTISIREKRLKILLDPMYGVSKTSLQTILMSARCDVDLIHDRHDTMFGGRLPSPSAATLHHLSHMVIEKGYDLGIGTDGDADRLGIIDERGNFIHPNDIMALLYYYLLEYKKWKGAVVRNLATTHLLDKIAEKYGEKSYEVPVGFKHISTKMEATDALIGGESSGGLTIRGHIKGKDGIFAATLLVEMISTTGKHLAEMLGEIREEFGNYVMIENGYTFNEEKKENLMKLLFIEKRLPEFTYEVQRIRYEDGVKIYFCNGGWIIARFSGTEPLLRIFAEMSTAEEAQIVSHQMREFLSL